LEPIQTVRRATKCATAVFVWGTAELRLALASHHKSLFYRYNSFLYNYLQKAPSQLQPGVLYHADFVKMICACNLSTYDFSKTAQQAKIGENHVN